jgi:uncharacterized membrane protein
MECRKCPAESYCQETRASWIFLFIGLIATFAVRLVNVGLHFSSVWAKACWYIGIIGFFFYFLYKYIQDQRIRSEIKNASLLEKIAQKKDLSSEDEALLRKVLCALRSQKDAVNYLLIFSSSAVALIIGFYQDFLR